MIQDKAPAAEIQPDSLRNVTLGNDLMTKVRQAIQRKGMPCTINCEEAFGPKQTWVIRKPKD